MKPSGKMLETSGVAPGNGKQNFLTINHDRREAFWAGAPIDLPELSFQFLASLAARGAQPTSYEDLTNEVWAGLSVSQDTIKQRARLVRDALAKAGAEKDVIQAVRSVGYRLVLPRPQQHQAHLSPSYLFAGGFSVLLLAAITAFLLFRSPSKPPEPTIAVMPISIIGAQTDSELAPTIEAELLSALGSLQGIRLISWQTMTALSNARARTLYEEAKASIVVEGSFRTDGDKKIIDLRGVDAKSEIVIWSYRYLTDASSPPGVERRIAQHAMRYLHDGALITQLSDARFGGSRKLSARTDFLNALAPFYSGQEEDLLKAREFLISAIEHDADFTAAHARLAEVYARLALRFDDFNAIAPAVLHAERAFAQAPDSALAHYSYGLALAAEGNKERALEELSVAAQTLPFAERDAIAIENRTIDN